MQAVPPHKDNSTATRLAKTFTLIFHPNVAELLIMWLMAAVSFEWHFYTVTLLFLLVIPFLGYFLYAKSKGISGEFAVAREHRFVPFAINLACLVLTAVAIIWIYAADPPPDYIPGPGQVLLMFAIIAYLLVANILALLVTFFFKVSLHITAAVAGLWAVGFYFTNPFFAEHHGSVALMLIVSVLLLGLIAWARLKLNAHTPAELICGLFVGSIVPLVVWVLALMGMITGSELPS